MPEPGGAGASPWRVLVLNQVAAEGLRRLPAGRYLTGPALADPDAVLVRSADLHAQVLPSSIKAVARAGVGTDNIPVAALSARGVPVFNTPGANANAVKELVLAGLLMAARNLAPALHFVQGLTVLGTPGADAAVDLSSRVEAGKRTFAGHELAGQTLGLIGLGRVGSLVAEAAIGLGMQVLGHDPEITVEGAWSLPAQVRRAASVDEVLRASHYISLHVPLREATRGLVNARNLALVQPGTVLLNFSREGVVDDAAALAAVDGGLLAWYVTDFPAACLASHARVLAFPHLGASTLEAEENCAVMAAEQLRDFLEHGHVVNSVNFPSVSLLRGGPCRLAIAHANVPSMLGQISTALAAAGLNIAELGAIEGLRSVRSVAAP